MSRPEIEALLAKKPTYYFGFSSRSIESDGTSEENYLYGDERSEGSYLWLKKEIQERLRYPENIFQFDDAGHRILCLEPFSIMLHDHDLVETLNKAFDCINPSRPDDLPIFTEDEAAEIIPEEADIMAIASDIHNIPQEPRPNVRDFTSLLNHNLCIGETHSDVAPKRFLQDNMKHLKERGYSTLFMEHIFYNTTMQESLDAYFAAPADAEMPRDIKCYLEYLGPKQSKQNNRKYDPEFNFLKVVEAAKEAGIRIVAIDSEAAYAAGNSYTGYIGSDRYTALNYLSHQIINHEMENREGKWITLVGETHMETKDGIPGISEITGAASVHIYDKDKELKIEFGRGSRSPNGIVNISSDVRIGFDPKTSLKVEEMIPSQEVLLSGREKTAAKGSNDCCIIA